jgi:ABC-type multidrug transport system fused ATPase/permease subunit
LHYYDGNPEDEGHVRELRLATIVRRFGPLLAPHKRRLAAGLGLLVASIGADLAGPLVLQRLVDVDIPSGSARAVLGSAAVFLALFLVARAAGFAQVVVLARMGLAVVTDLKRRTFDHLLDLSMEYFDRNPTGRLMSRVESDAERLLALFSEVGGALAGTALLFAGTIAFMFAADARIAAGVVVLMLPIFVSNVFYIRYLRKFYGRGRKVYARISSFLAEYVQAVPVVQVFALEGRARERLAERNRTKLETEVATAFREYPYWGALQAAEVGIVMAILYFGSRAVLGTRMSVGTLVLFVEYARRLFQPIVQFSEQLNFVQRAFASADRVFGILDTPSRTPDGPGARDEVPRGWRELRFEDVSFGYGAGAAKALDGVSFTVRRGERVALVGASGGGKTTIASLLLRFYDPTAGRIALDGEDLRAFRKRAWRRAVGLVLQEITLFPGTVAENLRVFAEGVTDEQVARALDAIDARELVDRLPRGLATDVAEGGANLSTGERQLLSFARAVLRDPEILVLDEATSSVDPATERRLQRSLEKLLADRTSIIIAHRLETVRRADRIIVMQGGRVAEEGTHAELYARGGLYRDLHDLQLKGEKAMEVAVAS